MQKRVFSILGIGFLILGIIFLANSFSSMTGFVIFEATRKTNSILGLVFILTGIILLASRQEEEGELEKELNKRGLKSITGWGVLGFEYERHLTGKLGEGQYDTKVLSDDEIRKLERNVFRDAVLQGLVHYTRRGLGYVEVDLKTFKNGKYGNFGGMKKGVVGINERGRKTSKLRIYFEFQEQIEKEPIRVHGYPR